MTAIESAEYQQTRDRLADDPHVQSMADDIAKGIAARHVNLADLYHDTGLPRFAFMQQANARYRALSGDDSSPRHMGAVGEAIWSLLHR